MAVQLLLDAATIAGSPSSNVLERQCMGRSILLLAVEDPSSFFKDKDSGQLLNEGTKLAERVGCRFMTISPSMTQSAQSLMYTEFFTQLMHNQSLPSLPYTVCTSHSSFATRRLVNLLSRLKGLTITQRRRKESKINSLLGEQLICSK